ncbi:hypothetical protein QL285_081102 [Trifolium repens]|nr:hypothetical protein QL285_081102 [Trifolium repens]
MEKLLILGFFVVVVLISHEVAARDFAKASSISKKFEVFEEKSDASTGAKHRKYMCTTDNSGHSDCFLIPWLPVPWMPGAGGGKTPETPAPGGGYGKPGKPEEPGKPGEPGGYPGEPEGPSEPGKPVGPGEPGGSEKPGEPAGPEEPGKPSEPGEPGGHEGSGEISEPGQPSGSGSNHRGQSGISLQPPVKS